MIFPVRTTSVALSFQLPELSVRKQTFLFVLLQLYKSQASEELWRTSSDACSPQFSNDVMFLFKKNNNAHNFTIIVILNIINKNHKVHIKHTMSNYF